MPQLKPYTTYILKKEMISTPDMQSTTNKIQ